MSILSHAVISIISIFVATSFGASMVFLLRKKPNELFSNIIFGITSGIMMSASIFGLIIPSIEQAKILYKISFIPIVVSIILGSLFLYLLDIFLNRNKEDKSSLRFFIAVTTHNIPEGLAVGLCYYLALINNDSSLLISAISLTLGIALQNVPEGLMVSLTLYDYGYSKIKSFIMGVLSGIVEPIFAFLCLFLFWDVTYLLPWLLSFAGGAMIYITIEELIPSSKNKGRPLLGVWSFIIGFCLMIILEMI